MAKSENYKSFAGLKTQLAVINLALIIELKDRSLNFYPFLVEAK
jgi:hypothetical protein